MLNSRIIPCLLLRNKGLVKTRRFKDPKYVGDPINAIRIFNEKEVDELIFLDIFATAENREPPWDLIEQIASECFMPVCYGGGIRTISDIRKIYQLGIEKVSISYQAAENPSFIAEAARIFGNQSIVVCLDVRRKLLGGYEVFTQNGTRGTGLDPVNLAKKMAENGAGEILINSIDHDGMMNGYDTKLLTAISKNIHIPVIALGGAGSLDDIYDIIKLPGVAAAAGSLFIFYGPHRAVLINYPERK